MNKDLGELARSNDKLWDEVDRIIPVSAELSGWFFSWAELAVQLRKRGHYRQSMKTGRKLA
jgi:hypothetical protein